MTLYRGVDPKYGPNRDAVLTWVVPVKEPVYTETAVRKALRIAVTWRGYDWQVDEIVNEIMREIGDTDAV